jgi:RNA recognition motif-containing protein
MEVMVKRIYVGNLPFTSTTEEVQELFEQYGSVNSVHMVADRDTGRPRGFGFVEMEDGEADAAINALDGFLVGGRNLKVNEARPRGEGGGGGGRGGGGGGRGRGGGGGGGNRW